MDEIIQKAGRDSALFKQYHRFVEYVSVSEIPMNHEDRLINATPDSLERLTLKILDPYDLVLSKLGRNSMRDRLDVNMLVKELQLDPETITYRFENYFKPYIAVAPEKTKNTFDLWMEELF